MSLALQPLLRSRYRRDTWTTILRDLFPDGAVTLLAAPAVINAPHDSVHATRQLGHLQLADDSRVALVEVEAADSVQPARNRRISLTLGLDAILIGKKTNLESSVHISLRPTRSR